MHFYIISEVSQKSTTLFDFYTETLEYDLFLIEPCSVVGE
jgi:hypothetical protein